MKRALLTVLCSALLPGCKLFAGCVQPDIPLDDNKETENDDVEETGGEDTQDTGPPPACDAPEAEPNNSQPDAQRIEMEEWACGVLEAVADIDTMRFTNEESGWMRAWARGADFGSNAELQIYLFDEDGDYTAIGLNQPGNTDPLLVVPIPEDRVWFAAISDQYYGYGPEHEWQFMASMAKAPLDWNVEESEANDTQETAERVSTGDRVYGVVEDGNDRDWFLFEVPDGKTDIELKIEAWNAGSPLDAIIRLYDPDGEKVRSRDSGPTASDFDPQLTYTASDPGDWAVVVQSDDGMGSGLYWYVLEINLVTYEEDTGDR